MAKWTRPTWPKLETNFDPEAQLDPTQPDFGPWGPNPTRKRVGFKSGLLSTYRKVEVEFESYLRSTLPNWTHFLDLEGQPDPFEPENWTQNQVEPEKNGLGLPALIQSVQVQSFKKNRPKDFPKLSKSRPNNQKKKSTKNRYIIGRIFSKTFNVQWSQQLRTYCYIYNLNKHAVPHDIRRSACLDKNVLTTYSTDIL